MTVRNIKKSLAGMEDIVQGIGELTQTRANNSIAIHRMDIPFAVSSDAEMSALDPLVYTRARVYSSTTEFIDYIYDELDGTGVPSDTQAGTWVIANFVVISHVQYFSTVAALKLADLKEGDVVQIQSYTASNNSGVIDGTIVAAATGVDDGGSYIDLPSSGLQFEQNFSSNVVDPRKWGAPNDGVSDDTPFFIAAATFLLSKTDPGGTILVDGRFRVMAGAVNFWDILATAQGITPANDFLPNGELVRGTYIALKGFGYERSRIRVIGNGDGFVWGNFTSIASKRAMSGNVYGIDFRGDGVIGHTSQLLIDNGFGQTYATTTTPTVGTTNVGVRCLVFEECVPNTFVDNCRFRHFQEAIHQTYGFGFVADRNDIQYCNIGIFFDAGVTTWDVRSGNEIEVSAVGVFSKNTSNGHIGAAVIEANTAGCDVLVWISKFLSMDGTWFEGSLQNVVAIGDLTAPSLPNSGWGLSNIVGLNIDSNGGMVNFHAENCAMNILGESFSANTGEHFENIAYENCTLNEGPFDASTISVSGIAALGKIKIKGETVNGDIANYQSRENLVKKAVKSAASSTGNNTCFTLEIDNAVTTGRIEIEGYWRTDPANDYQMYTFKYVGVISRNIGGASVVTFLANESASTLYPATGTNVPNLPTLPNTTVTGAASATQEVTVEFALGTAVGQSADTLYTATIMNQTDDVRFK